MSESEPKVGDKCPYCVDCILKSFRIDVDEWILKCESSKCMYPIAITKEQRLSCREATSVSETEILDDFLGEILSNTTVEPPDLTELQSDTSTSASFLEQAFPPVQLIPSSAPPTLVIRPQVIAPEIKQEPVQKISRSLKHMEFTKALSSANGKANSSPVKKIRGSQIIRRIIKREPGGSQEPKEVVQSVTHMKPLDYVKYFMERNRTE